MIIWQIPGWEYVVAYSPWGSIAIAVIFAALFLALGIAIGINAAGRRIVNHAATRAASNAGNASPYDHYRL